MANAYASSKAYLIYDVAELNYDFGAQHPLQARRLAALVDLLATSRLWSSEDQQHTLPLRAATEEELRLIHTSDYIDAVKRLSARDESLHNAKAKASSGVIQAGDAHMETQSELALRYGFGEGDTPVLPGMHEVASLIAGGTLVALSAVMGLPEGGLLAHPAPVPLHVLHPAGGLHHAWADRASGFCVYNDIALAIAHILRATEAKVLYIDFDAHHGDGVQRAFYDDPRVMTISLHETGRYLFPGTGDVLELGHGLGRGYTVNVPLEPFTEDESYIEALHSLLLPLVTFFAPDVIVTQHGCDTHAWDPLTHLSLTLRSMQEQVKLSHELAHSFCQGRWVAVGGGGYDLYRVVPRAWSILWADMSEQALPDALPQAWIERWQPEWLAVREQEEVTRQAMGKAPTTDAFPATFQDREDDFPPQARRSWISRTNQHTVGLVRQLLTPAPIRQAFPLAQRRSPLTSVVDLLRPRGGGAPSRSQTLKTKMGSVLLRDFCPPSLVERLHADSGLKAFARVPEREQQLLLGIAKNPDCALALAHTPTGEIIGEVTIAPGDVWWEGVDPVYEVAIEVSSNWRGQGIARNLLAFALELEAIEDIILFALGLSWHWDTEGTGLSLYRYREMIERLFASQGFKEYPTTEPNISMEPANILLARVGSHVDQRSASQFFSRLLSSPRMAGL